MLFTEARFFAFLAVVWSVHWALRAHRARKVWLLAASLVFYGAWDWRFLGLLLGSAVLDYFAGRGIARATTARARRAWLGLSLAGNLGALGLFKYFDFFAASAAEALTALGFRADPVTLGLVLPVGISFYTFQTLSYTLDIRRGTLQPVRDFTDFALFVAFFPQLVAGPIVRAAEFLPQLARPRRREDVALRSCLLLFLAGFVKKACVADNLAPVVDAYYADPASYGAGDAWLALVLYSIQIYGDFSGYSDMAIALAGLFGYRLLENFRFPYLASTFTDLWRRWHMTLATWLKDYVYVPLGGSRAAPVRAAANLLVTWLLCGLWHGAAWTYVAWGFLNGVFLVAERAGLGARVAALPRPVQVVYVQVAWIAGLAIFRAPDLASAGVVLQALGGLAPAPSGALDARWWVVVAALAAAHWVAWRGWVAPRLEQAPAWAFAGAYGGLVALTLPWVAVGYQPFIYFQF